MTLGATLNSPAGSSFGDTLGVFTTIANPGAPLRSVVASTTQPDVAITLGGPGRRTDGHRPTRALRADSGAVLYCRCDGGSCQVYETRFDNPATSVPIGVPVAVTNSAYWQAQYSADGERIIYLREESNPSPFARVVEVTRRDSPGETIHVTPSMDSSTFSSWMVGPRRGGVDARRRVGARMTLTNVDLPLVSLDLGEDAARYQTYAVLPR